MFHVEHEPVSTQPHSCRHNHAPITPRDPPTPISMLPSVSTLPVSTVPTPRRTMATPTRRASKANKMLGIHPEPGTRRVISGIVFETWVEGSLSIETTGFSGVLRNNRTAPSVASGLFPGFGAGSINVPKLLPRPDRLMMRLRLTEGAHPDNPELSTICSRSVIPGWFRPWTNATLGKHCFHPWRLHQLPWLRSKSLIPTREVSPPVSSFPGVHLLGRVPAPTALPSSEITSTTTDRPLSMNLGVLMS